VSRKPRSLLQRTRLILAIGLAAFLGFTALVIRVAVLEPVTQRAASELAALIELSARVWVELPPRTRPDFEAELRDHHELRVRPPAKGLQRPVFQADYLDHVETDIAERLGVADVALFDDPKEPGWHWVDVPVADRVLQFGFHESRLEDWLHVAVLLIGAAGGLFILVSALFVVQRLTAPLAEVESALQKLGRGQPFEPLPEEGPTEFAKLAVRVNRAEREIAALLANRTTLLAGVSHDLRTPLTRMQLELELMDGKADAHLLDGLRKDLVEMEELIARTMELARGLDSHEASDAELGALLEQVRASYARGGSEIAVSMPSSCTVLVPPKAFRRVLTNLLDNAVRYSGGKRVDVVAECRPDSALVRVIDRGPGIPVAQRDAVLRPFHRLEGSRSRGTGGSGLGLAIVRQLCEAQGWMLTLADAPTGGLEVRVEVPRTA
jgi:two-component system, OmpR family, osmolarity sensor histidine kinase EnvZ